LGQLVKGGIVCDHYFKTDVLEYVNVQQRHEIWWGGLFVVGSDDIECQVFQIPDQAGFGKNILAAV